MSSYYAAIVDDGTGVFQPYVLRGGSAPSGGTSVSFPVQENFDGSYGSQKTRLLGEAFQRCQRAAQADRASGN